MRASFARAVFLFVIALRLANLATGRDTSGYGFQFNNVYSSHCGSEFRPPSMASASEEDDDVLDSSSMRHALVLDAQLPTVALSMHRVYHIVVAKSLVSESLQAHSALDQRQDQKKAELCNLIASILPHGVPAASLASASGNYCTDCRRHRFG